MKAGKTKKGRTKRVATRDGPHIGVNLSLAEVRMSCGMKKPIDFFVLPFFVRDSNAAFGIVA